MDKIYLKSHTTMSWINYHFIFCPRYRRQIFKDDSVANSFEELVVEVCEELNLTLIDVTCGRDYAHIHLNALPKYSPASIMAKIKGVSSKRLREEFTHLEHLESLWTRSYLVTTEEYLSDEVIGMYVSKQKKRG